MIAKMRHFCYTSEKPIHMTFARILIVLAAISWPLSASAAAPAGVAGLFAEVQGQEIHIRWNAPQEGEDIFAYRVYYSTQSILENGGAYEDFETTDGHVMEHILRDFPRVSSLFLSVLAVNSQGEESEFFLEEVEVDVSSVSPTPVLEEEVTPEPAVEEIPTEAVPPEIGSAESSDGNIDFILLAVQAVSSTGVLLEFSLPVSLKPEDAASAIRIVDASGTVLPLVRLSIKSSLLLIDTVPQEAGKVYSVELTSAVHGQAADGTLAFLETDGSKTLFTGFNIVPGQTITSVIPTDVEALNLRASIVRNRYAVQGTWRSNAAPGAVSFFELRHSRDGGATYSEIQTVPANATAVEFQGVEPGTFLLHVRAVSPTGHTSRGVVASIQLPAITRPSNGLPGSGMGIATAALMAGAVMGIRRMRKVRKI